MDKEKIRELYKLFEQANKNYDDFVNQFLTTTVNGVVTKESTKIFTSENINDIQKLRGKKERTWKLYKEAFNSWFDNLSE